MAQGPTFTLEEALGLRREVRGALDLGEERFDRSDLMRMIGDEVEAMRAAGRTTRTWPAR